MVRVNRFLVDTIVTCEGERHDTDPPWGIFGGHDGMNASMIRNAGQADEERWPSKVTAARLSAGDTLQITVPNSAGYGDPLERDPELVLSDVLDGFTTVELAERDYGVVIDGRGLAVDREATSDCARSGSRCRWPKHTRGSFVMCEGDLLVMCARRSVQVSSHRLLAYHCDNGLMSDPTWGTRSASGSERPPKGGDSVGDDWRWDDIEWFEETWPPGSKSGSATRAGGEPKAGLAPAARDAGSQPSRLSGRTAVIRNRRIAALAALSLLFILALVISLVVFGGGGAGVAEQTTTPLTSAERTTTPARTTTRPSTTTGSTVTTPKEAALRVARHKARLCAAETAGPRSRTSRKDCRRSSLRQVRRTQSSVRPPRLQ